MSIDEIKISQQNIIINLIQTIHPNHLAIHTGKQEERSCELGDLAAVLKRTVTEP